MKKIALLALAASTAAIATPAMAQTVTGTINITGSVAEKCAVVTGASGGNSFGGTVAMGELSQANGTLKASTDLANTFGAAANTFLSARVVCTTATPKIAVKADPLATTTAAASGYANTVHYKANVLVNKVGGTQSFFDDTVSGGGTATALTAPFAATGNNVTVSASDWRTPNVGDLLVAATDYTGKIVITITPL